MNYKILSSILSIVIVLFLIIKNSLAFNPIRFHCPNYILNSYLYLFLSIAIVFTSLLSLEESKIDSSQIFKGNAIIFLFILSMLLIFALIYVGPEYFFTKHALWILYLIISGIFIYPIFQKKKGIFYQSGLTTLLLITCLSIVTFVKPELISDNWFLPLFIGLIVLIGTRIIERLLSIYGVIDNRIYSKLISYVGILLFSFWTLYDTKQLIKRGANCVNPDYINQSLDIFLDALNIFVKLTDINEK